MQAPPFQLDDDILYLNHAAVSPWPRASVEAVCAFAQENGHRGSRHYPRWLRTEQALRERLARLIGVPDTRGIALLKNTSEALSLVAGGLDWQPGDEVLIPADEFASNRIVWEALAPQGVRVREVPPMAEGPPSRAWIEALGERTRLVAVSSVHYATGLRLDLEPIGQACRERGILFCVDAIQSLGALPFDAPACNADFVMADGHKWMLGPEGLALFWCRPEHLDRLHLQQYGWHMVEAMGDYARRDWRPAPDARRFECGSPNMLGIHALHASLGLLLETGIPAIFNKLSRNIDYLIDLIDSKGGVLLSARPPESRAGIVTFRHPREEPGRTWERLQAANVMCALRGGGIRFSPHFYTSFQVIEKAVEIALSGED
ncbi:MAG TPA: aminotransferase class V-fold PLP-dependent enzyme [Gammaproteobacteria bacterium]|nr:aminotransferase class V-fold PLP-dependent enzyme [Gammaproteobacteria bacterium]